MMDLNKELTEESVIEIEPISQEGALADRGWGGGGGEKKEGSSGSQAIAITEPENTEQNDKTRLQIFHDHDKDETTEAQPVDESIAVDVVADGYTYQLEAVGDGSETVFWSSDNADIATVDKETGLVTFTGAAGEVNIRLNPNDGSGTVADVVTFTVTAAVQTDPVQTDTSGTEVTETTGTTETTEPHTVQEAPGGAMDFLLGHKLELGIAGAALILALAVALVMRRIRKKQQRRRSRPEMRLDQDGERTEVHTGPVKTNLTVPSEDSVSAVQPMTGIRAGVYQAVGARKDQQDSFGMTDPALYAQQGVLALVADGMGGLANGKAVSSTLVNTFLGEYRNLVDREMPQDALVKLSISANQRINQMLVGADRSGSTLVSVVIRDGLLYFLTVGDSRIYLYRSGALLQLNREHIYQEELVVKAANCLVPLSQVTGDRQAHALTSFFGSGSITYLDRNYEGIRLVPGDRVLLCSDGVFGTLSQAQMERAMEYDVRTAAETLKNMVLDAGKPHQDNNTCVILEYLG